MRKGTANRLKAHGPEEDLESLHDIWVCVCKSDSIVPRGLQGMAAAPPSSVVKGRPVYKNGMKKLDNSRAFISNWSMLAI